MSNIKVITAKMHKIAELTIDVKFRCPGNVIKYKPVDFEVHGDGEHFFAIPLESDESKRITNLPRELSFHICGGRVFSRSGREEVVEEIVNKLIKMNLIESFSRIASQGTMNVYTAAFNGNTNGVRKDKAHYDYAI